MGIVWCEKKRRFASFSYLVGVDVRYDPGMDWMKWEVDGSWKGVLVGDPSDHMVEVSHPYWVAAVGVVVEWLRGMRVKGPGDLESDW